MSFKLQNTSDFRQAVVVEGNRILMLPDDVIEANRLISYVWLEQVADDTPVTVTASRRISTLKSRMEELQNANADAVISSRDELDDLEESIKNSANDVLECALAPITNELDKTQNDIASLLANYQEFKNTMTRRLEIMKGAMMTLQQDFYEIEFDDDGRLVDDTKS